MASISINNLIDIQPSVVGTGGNPLSLNTVVITENKYVPYNQVLSFIDTDAVTNFFGEGVESEIASNYFNGFDNSNVKPNRIYYSLYDESDGAAYVKGASNYSTLAELQSITPALGTGYAGCTGFSCTTVSNSTLISITMTSGMGSLAAGDTIIGTGIPDDTVIIEQLTGTSGASGNYRVSKNATASGTITANATSNILHITAASLGEFQVGQNITTTGMTELFPTITALLTGSGGIGTYRISDKFNFVSRVLNGIDFFIVKIDGIFKYIYSLDLSSCTSFESVASVLNNYSGASVGWDTHQQSFVISSRTSGESSVIEFPYGLGSKKLGLTSDVAVISQGYVAMTPTSCMNIVKRNIQNWACFMTTFEPSLSNKLLFANWTNNQNQRYAYVCWDTDGSPTASTDNASFGHNCISREYDGIVPIYSSYDVAGFVCGSIASINFNQLDGRITLAYKSQSGLVPNVTDETIAANLINNGYNFYGAYSTSNSLFNFFQNGQMPGKWKWIDSYINQIYLNAQIQLAIVDLLSNSKSLPYNAEGYSLLFAACMDPIKQALNNGTIRTGINLSTLQAAQINNSAGTKIDNLLTTQGWYLQILPATAQVRGLRQSPPLTLWYTDGGSIQKINMESIDIL